MWRIDLCENTDHEPCAINLRFVQYCLIHNPTEQNPLMHESRAASGLDGLHEQHINLGRLIQPATQGVGIDPCKRFARHIVASR